MSVYAPSTLNRSKRSTASANADASKPIRTRGAVVQSLTVTHPRNVWSTICRQYTTIRTGAVPWLGLALRALCGLSARVRLRGAADESSRLRVLTLLRPSQSGAQCLYGYSAEPEGQSCAAKALCAPILHDLALPLALTAESHLRPVAASAARTRACLGRTNARSCWAGPTCWSISRSSGTSATAPIGFESSRSSCST